MRLVQTTLTEVSVGIPTSADSEERVTYTCPAGCVLRTSTNLVNWSIETRPSGFIHTGAKGHYRIDCDAYDGTPKTTWLEITKL